ncbi:MAG: PqqD family protein [Holophagales bacterium]|nr:PqqD family protein [Holophagales bacterium]
MSADRSSTGRDGGGPDPASTNTPSGGDRPGIYRPAPDALFRRVGEEAVILDLATQRYFGLDEVGARLWQLMEELGELDAIARALAVEFEVTAEQARRDAEALFVQLTGHGLLLPPDPPAEGE